MGLHPGRVGRSGTHQDVSFHIKLRRWILTSFSLFVDLGLLNALVDFVVRLSSEYGAVRRNTVKGGAIVHRSLESVALPSECVIAMMSISSPKLAPQ